MVEIKKRFKLVAMLLVLVGVLNACHSNRKEIKSLQLHISLQESQMIFYGDYNQLITLSYIIDDNSEVSFDKYAGDYYWYVSDSYWDNASQKWIWKYVVFDIDEIERLDKGKGALTIKWHDSIPLYYVHRQDVSTFNEKEERIYFFSEKEFISKDTLLRFTFSEVKIKTVYPSFLNSLFDDRPMNYSLSFKEIFRDVQGVTFQLVEINDRVIGS